MNGTHTHDNDNEELSFITLAAVTANVVRYLNADENQNEHSDRQTGRRRTEEEKAKDERAYVEQRLRELRAWERRISGRK